MLNVNPKYRRPLSAKQVSLLQVVFKFRFVSSDLLAEYLGKDRSSVYENLYVLVKQEYIAKRYDQTYRLRQRPASYCLSTKGIRYLRENTNTSEKALRNMYKNKNIDETLIDKCLLVMRIANTLHKQTNNKFDIVTKYELTDQEFFLRPLPDLYLSRKKPKKGHKFDYTLDIFEPNLPTWVLRKRLRDYQEHCYEAELEDNEYPNVLLVASNDSTERRLHKQFKYSMQDFEVYVTTLERLLNPENIHKPVWKDDTFDEDDEDEEVELRGL
jgi:DNA-binding PadR family transcriptional regulator